MLILFHYLTKPILICSSDDLSSIFSPNVPIMIFIGGFVVVFPGLGVHTAFSCHAIERF